MHSTHKSIRRRIANALMHGVVFHHEVTEDNSLGQSGMHTVASDLIDIVLNASNEAEAFKNIMRFLDPDLDK